MLATSLSGDASAPSGLPNVEVFKTNVASRRQAFVVVSMVQAQVAGCRVTLDLDDCDRVLRVQDYRSPHPLPVADIRRVVRALGFEIEVLA